MMKILSEQVRGCACARGRTLIIIKYTLYKGRVLLHVAIKTLHSIKQQDGTGTAKHIHDENGNAVHTKHAYNHAFQHIYTIYKSLLS